MTKDVDDLFKPKLGRIHGRGGSRAKSYVNRVLHQISAAGKSGFGNAHSKRFTGTRIGRGNDALRRYRAGHRFGSASRRVIIKSRIVKLVGAASGQAMAAARAHLRYIQRDGVSKELEPGRLYDANGDNADGGAFTDRCEGDRHQFRFIASPEDATELGDLKPFVRDLMQTVEKDLGTRLDWVAVDHFNTEHPHSHIVLRGKDDQGKNLVIAGDYIAHGMRRRASELLTLELGPQTEQEIRHKLERQVGQDRFTELDRRLVLQVEDGIVNMRAGREARDRQFQQAQQLGRLRVLERRGLAEETAPGRWRLSPTLEQTLRRAGERDDIIKTMHRGLMSSGLDAGATEYAIFDPGDRHASPIIGQIIDRGLHDEHDDRPYILVDATDGRVHYAVTDPKQDMEDVPIGAIVELQPASAVTKPSDRTIAGIARHNDGFYSAEIHHHHDPRASAEFVAAHVRRLEALRRQNIVRRLADGTWKIPGDFEGRVSRLSQRPDRLSARVVTLSFVSLENQTTAEGATWLDRRLLAKEPLAARGERFGANLANALHRRQQHLINQVLARKDSSTIHYQRNLLQHLRKRELADAASVLEQKTGASYFETQDGERINGIYRQPLRLASGKFAVLEKSKEFTLVPWRPVLEQYRGKAISGTVRGSSVSFEFSRKKGIGLS